MLRASMMTVVSLAMLGVATSERANADDVAPIASATMPARFLRGVAVTLHDEDPERDYGSAVAEVAELGASAASVVVHLSQDDAASAAPARPAKRASDTTILRTIRAARGRGLDVMVVPVVLLERPGADWRGKLRPPDEAAWFAAYEREVLRFARLAREGGATVFCVGSELCSLERRADLWRALIARVRKELPRVPLTYGANWDHYDEVPFWDALDVVGLSGYYELTKSIAPSDDELVQAWTAERAKLLAWRAGRAPEKKILFTEIGYASQRGCASKPWDYYLSREVDVAAQRQAYDAFARVFGDPRDLAGVFFYEWWGSGGLEDTTYTPRGKPAAQIIRTYFKSIATDDAKNVRETMVPR